MAHSVLQIPVPALERFVRERTAHHDPSFVSSDPAFGHAHVTALGPFLPQLDDGAADKVAQIAAGTAPFDFSLDRVATFPDGVIHLVPDPEEPFRDLTARLVEAFPQCPPYGGQFDDVRPHLTLDATADGVDEGTVRAALGSVVPAACRGGPPGSRLVGVRRLPGASVVAAGRPVGRERRPGLTRWSATKPLEPTRQNNGFVTDYPI